MKRREPKIIDGNEYWFCPHCKTYKLRYDYYESKRSFNGIKNICKLCSYIINQKSNKRVTIIETKEGGRR